MSCYVLDSLVLCHTIFAATPFLPVPACESYARSTVPDFVYLEATSCNSQCNNYTATLRWFRPSAEMVYWGVADVVHLHLLGATSERWVVSGDQVFVATYLGAAANKSKGLRLLSIPIHTEEKYLGHLHNDYYFIILLFTYINFPCKLLRYILTSCLFT